VSVVIIGAVLLTQSGFTDKTINKIRHAEFVSASFGKAFIKRPWNNPRSGRLGIFHPERFLSSWACRRVVILSAAKLAYRSSVIASFAKQSYPVVR
jgi:hypothetical protein